MTLTTRCLTLALPVMLLAPPAARAQAVPPPTASGPTQVLSVNPFGMLIDVVNAEYEVRVGAAVTAGAGASRIGWGDTPSVNGDLFVRYFPAGQAFDGRSFGLKAGLTRCPGEPVYFGVGVDANQTWMLNPHFAFSTGLGLKRLVGVRAGEVPVVVPTFRFNVGVGF